MEKVDKLKKYIITLLILIFFDATISYSATKSKVYLTANKDILEIGEEIEITINLQNSKTSAYNANIYFDDTKMELISKNDNIYVIGNHIIILWYDKQGEVGAKEGKLETLVFKAKQEGIANFTIQGQFYNEKAQEIETEFNQLQIQIGKEETELEKQAKQEQGTDKKLNNANLQDLRINQEGIVPNFKTDIYEYYLTVTNDVKEIEILSIPENQNATIQINGNENLIEGLNTIEINVISEDRTETKTYKIYVTKTNNVEKANTNLETLAIENTLFYPNFQNDITSYTAEISEEIQNLNILAIPENENANVSIYGNDNLNEGNNIVKITVTAPNRYTKKEITINIYKRNKEEEIKYDEEQKNMENKLEEAYEIEKVSSDETGQNVKENQKDKIKYNLYIPIIIILILSIFITIYIKNKLKK